MLPERTTRAKIPNLLSTCSSLERSCATWIVNCWLPATARLVVSANDFPATRCSVGAGIRVKRPVEKYLPAEAFPSQLSARWSRQSDRARAPEMEPAADPTGATIGQT